MQEIVFLKQLFDPPLALIIIYYSLNTRVHIDSHTRAMCQ